MKLRLAELLARLSLTIDLGGGAPMEKGLRTRVVATGLPDDLELDPGDRRAVYHAALPMGAASRTRASRRICEMRYYADTAKHMAASAEAGLADSEERAAQYG